MNETQAGEPPASIVAHVSLGTANYSEALVFYDRVLATLGVGRFFEEHSVKAVAYGRQFPEFWLQAPFDGRPPSVGNGYHVAFLASSQQQVNDFYQAALAAGAADDGEPGARPHYGDAYYGCFVRDLDGHKIEAMYWNENQSNS